MKEIEKIRFSEGDILVREGFDDLMVVGGSWVWAASNCSSDPTISEQAIIDALTEIVKPLRTHMLDGMIIREDGMFQLQDDFEGWQPIWQKQYNRDLFKSWGWPLPDHMKPVEEKADDI